MNKEERINTLLEMADDERMKAYVWEAIEEALKVMNNYGVATAWSYASSKANTLRGSAIKHTLDARDLQSD